MANSSKIDVVGVGLNATDTLIPLSSYPALGSKVEFLSANVLPGGQVATAMVACRQWGLQTRYVGKLGDDSAGKLHRDEFARAGVQTEIITVPDCSSQQTFIIVDGTGERTILWRHDERLTIQPKELRREWILDARVLHVDGYDTAAATVATGWAREAGIPTVADLDELYPGVEKLIANIDYLIVSRDIPGRLMQEDDLEAALRGMHKRFGNTLTAATLGPEGVLVWDGKQFHYNRAYQVPVVDTTGAGDIFHAGFIYGLLQEWPLQQILDFACAAASLNCAGVGARGGIQTLETIENLRTKGKRYPAACFPSIAETVNRDL